MATPPTFVAEYEFAWDSTSSPKTVSTTVADGDLLVHVAVSSEDETPLATPTGGTGVTWTPAQSTTTTDKCQIYSWTSAPAAQTFTLSQAKTSGTQWWGGDCLRFSDTGGVGASNEAEGNGTAPSVSLTTTQDNSSVVVVCGDWSAADGSSRTWRTVNSYTPTAGNGGEKTYFRDSLWYTTYIAVYPDVGAAGTYTFGLTAPNQNWTIHAVEVLGDSGPPRDVMPVDLRAAGTWDAPASSATVTPGYPTDENLDLIAATLAIKPNTATVATPGSWSAGPVNAVGGGTQGAGTGACQSIVFTRQSDGSLSGGSQAFTITSGSSPVGVMHAWSYDSTGYTDPQWAAVTATSYSRTTGSTTFGGTGAANLNLAAGDVLGYISISADDQSATHTISGLAATGCTLDTLVVSPNTTIINGQGNDISAAFAYAKVLDGTSSAAPSATVTGSTSETGGGVFFRIRATGVAVTGDTWTGSSSAAEASGASGSFTPGAATWTGSTPSATASGSSGAFTPGPVTWTGAAASATADATSGTFTPGAATWTGTAADVTADGATGSYTPGAVTWGGSTGTVEHSAAAGAFSTDSGPQTWTGSSGTIEASGTSGAFTPGAVTWSGVASAAETSGTSGTFTPGTATWTGTAASATTTGTTGSFTPGLATWTGSAGTVEATGTSGAWSAQGTWTGTPANITATGTSGSFIGPQTWTGSTAGVTATGDSGSFAPGVVTWGGNTAAVSATGATGVWSSTATWAGSAAATDATGTTGTWTPGDVAWAATVGIEITATGTSGYFAAGELGSAVKRPSLELTIPESSLQLTIPTSGLTLTAPKTALELT